MSENIRDKHELNQIPRVLIKALLVVIIALIPMLLLNQAMQSFLDDELAVVQAAAEKAALAQQALDNADEMERERLEAELAVLKAEQYEEFYQKYKNRESYHYYGQFYEMFENMYNADVLFLGTSHTAHGVNPLYIEEEFPEHSFYNFGLNGATPGYYLDWYDVFKESGYPTPEYIVYCVDWFMCDDGWLWRRIAFDDSPDKPIDIMRKIRATKETTSSSVSDTQVVQTVEEAETTTAIDIEIPKEEKVNFWDVDELLTTIFNKIPVIYSRDRIPEMLRYYFSNQTVEIDEPALTDKTNETDETDDEEKLPQVPVYEHSYLADGIGNLTSAFYKGFIPWNAGYEGWYSVAQSNDNEVEWRGFEKLLGKFVADGIKIIFIEIPEYIPGRKAINFERNNERLRKLAAEYDIEFLNYNEELASEINEDYKNYSDWGHLNQKGSTAFSKVLAEDLKNLLN